MRLIDADALKETGKRWFIDERYYHPLEKPQNMSESTFLKLIDNAPTIDEVEQNEYKSCKGCKYYSYGCFNGHPCINCQRNSKLVDEIREQKNDLWKDGTPK